MFNDLTIAFSGHNLRWIAVFAIESFLKYYPEMRSNIVYFDDESTDGTVRELERRGIKVIGWSPELKEKFKNIQDIHATALTVRVSFIYRCIMEQVKTKYLMFHDGDVVFLRGGFIEKFMEQIENGNKIVTSMSYFPFNKHVYRYMLEDPKKFGLYTKYIVPGKEVGQPEYDYAIRRVFFMQSLMDLDYFKSINLLGDDLDDLLPQKDKAYVDTSVNFSCHLWERKIPVYEMPDKYVYDNLFHWGWLASANRDNRNNLDVDYAKHVAEKFETTTLTQIALDLGLKPARIIQSISNTVRKTNSI